MYTGSLSPSSIMRSVAVITLVLLEAHPAFGCSFVVANFNVTQMPTRWAVANYYNQRRGPDATFAVGSHGWSFVHNLLSMTGAFTRQPFFSDDGKVAVLFNGEIYNYRQLAATLTGDESAYASDGYAILPAYRHWGVSFPTRLEGEFAIALVDFAKQHMMLITDAFSTKPLWYATWGGRFVAASYQSVLAGLGAPTHTHQMAEPNEALLVDFRSCPKCELIRRARGTCRSACKLKLLSRDPLVKWDLRQHKSHTCDWQAAFEEAVRVRSSGTKHRMFIGLSSG